jgi:hypothetical protein
MREVVELQFYSDSQHINRVASPMPRLPLRVISVPVDDSSISRLEGACFSSAIKSRFHPLSVPLKSKETIWSCMG